jgi:hypothetical protein
VRWSPNGINEFNAYKIIPHYCNNVFALQMYTFTIFALIFNTLNSPFIKTPHSRIFHITEICTLKYIVKKLQKQDFNSFHNVLLLHQIHTTI